LLALRLIMRIAQLRIYTAAALWFLMSNQKEGNEEEKKKLLIPSFLTADVFKKERKAPMERRLRLRRRSDVDEGKAFMNPGTMKELNITTEIEAVLAGGGARERKYVFRVTAKEDVPPGEVWCNEEELRRNGVADNSIATIRAHRREQDSA